MAERKAEVVFHDTILGKKATAFWWNMSKTDPVNIIFPIFSTPQH